MQKLHRTETQKVKQIMFPSTVMLPALRKGTYTQYTRFTSASSCFPPSLKLW